MIEELKECFNEDFTTWLLNSNMVVRRGTFSYNEWIEIENECLTQILDILIREPLADYFWYTYPESGSRLIYSLPSDEVVPSDALRIDSGKVKALLRDKKLNDILN